MDPWTNLAKAKLAAEKELKNIDLNLAIVRPALVYGPGDTQGLIPRFIVGRVYKKIDKEMMFLWTKDLRINTVHVEDVCRALCHLCGVFKSKKANGEIFNLADKQDTDQETINGHIRSIFKIKTGFHGSILSNLARLNLSNATQNANETHLEPWYELLKESNISTSPLTPYLDEELLYNNSLSVDGTKIESTGFQYIHPTVEESKIREIIKGYQDQNLWPKDL